MPRSPHRLGWRAVGYRLSRGIVALERVHEPRQRGNQFTGHIRWRQRDLERGSAARRVALNPRMGGAIIVSGRKGAEQLTAEAREG